MEISKEGLKKPPQVTGVFFLQLISNDCNYPIVFAYYIIVQAVIFLGFFCEFYIKAYLSSSKGNMVRILRFYLKALRYI